MPPGASVHRHRRRARAASRASWSRRAAGWRSSISSLPTRELDADVVVFTQDLDEAPTFDVRGYDYLLLLDVIEHLKNPEEFLERLRAQFDYAPRTLVLTTPNIAFGDPARACCCSGSSTTARPAFSTARTRACSRSGRCSRLLVDAGFRIKEIRGVPAPFPKVLGDGLLGRAATAVNQLLIRHQPVAVLVSDLRGRRGDAGRRLHPGGCQAAGRGPRSSRIARRRREAVEAREAMPRALTVARRQRTTISIAPDAGSADA